MPLAGSGCVVARRGGSAVDVDGAGRVRCDNRAVRGTGSTVAEETAKGGVPAAVRQLLQERAREGVALPAPAAPAEVGQPECLAPVTKDLSLPELKEAFQKDMYAFLLEPWVKKALKRILRSKDTKGARELFATMLHALLPQEKHAASGPAKVVLISKIERPGTQTVAAKIETPR